jgi:RNA polymerase sigma-70 factor (sigma-E family)
MVMIGTVTIGSVSSGPGTIQPVTIDGGLMADAVTGEFEQFFRLQHPRLVAIALALTGDVEVARDAAQEGLLRAYRDWSKVVALELPSAWVRRVVVNLAIDGRRRRARDQRVVARLATRPTGDATDAAHDAEESSATWQAVRGLPDRQRAAVVLRYVDDLTVAEIAEILRVSDGTVKASLHKARRTLEQRLGPEER